MATTKFAKRQIVRKSTHERKRKAVRKFIRTEGFKQYLKSTEEMAKNWLRDEKTKDQPMQRTGYLMAFFRKMIKDIRRGKVAKVVAQKEAKAKERAKLRKENAKKNS